MQQLQPDLEETHICHMCVGDEVLREKVRLRGAMRPCSYCGRVQPTLLLGEIAQRIHEVMAEQFELTPDHPVDINEFITIAMGLDWDRKAEPAAGVIAEIADLDQAIAADVAHHLSKSFGWREARHGGEDPYGPEAHHEQKAPDTSLLKNSWTNFREDIQTRARFFGNYAEATLAEIFADLTTLRTFVGKPAVREIGPNDAERFVYRGRNARSPEELYAILRSPASELGPPPSQIAASGRMNSAGIPVFYGAQERKICVAEVRPPVGGHVVTGKFELIRKVRLLDLDRLARAFVETSHFDERYTEHYARYAFLRQLVAEITAPVLPQEETKEYLPTQVIADFLAFRACPKLDGILFRSSQTEGNGQNVVLFNRASHVEPMLIPRGTRQEVSMPRSDEDGFGEDEVIIFEKSDTDPGELLENETPAGVVAKLVQVDEHPTVEITPTLRFDPDSMEVHEIQRMEPEFTDLPVRRVKAEDNRWLGHF